MRLTESLPIFTFIIVIFILGVGFGAISVKTVDYSIRENLFTGFTAFMQEYNQLEYDHYTLINESIKFNLFNLLIVWVLGLTVVLAPLIALLVFFKGFVLGFTVGFLISEYSTRGLLLATAAVFPQNVLIVPAYIMAAVLGIYFSLRLFRHYRGKDRLKFEDLFSYTSRLALAGIVLLGGSLLETAISPYLFGLILRFF